MVALEQKSAWKGWQVDTEQQSNLLWKLSKTPYGANNSSAQIFKEKPSPVYLVWNSSMPCNSHQQLCTATRGIAGPLINFIERRYLKMKNKKKPDGEGAGQDFTHPYFVKKGCSWIFQRQSPGNYKQFLYFSGKLNADDLRKWNWFRVHWQDSVKLRTHQSQHGSPSYVLVAIMNLHEALSKMIVISKTSSN